MTPVLDTVAQIRAGQLGAAAGVETALSRIAARDPAVNAVTHVLAERARARARLLDGRIAAAGDPGPLAGLCFAVKNLFDVAGVTTLAGSRIWQDHAPAARDAFAIRKLEAAGAILVGALNMDEFASGFTTENSHHGATRNPHDPGRTAGGSSGGSAAAVAAGMVPLALATDTNGSIRVPAAACGVFGLKPTYGRLSRGGVALFAESFDHVGPIAADLPLLEAAYRAMLGQDADDPAQAETPPGTRSGAPRTAPLRVARAGGTFFEQCDDVATQTAIRAAEALGARGRLALPGVEAGWSAAVVITLVEGSDIHLPDLRRDAEGFDPMTRDRFLAGALVPSSAYLSAQRARRLWRSRALAALAETDVLVTPALPFDPPPLGCDSVVVAGRSVDPRGALGQFTQPFSCIGLPALVVPLAGPSGLPRAVQLVAHPWREDHLFQAARTLVDLGLAAPHILP
jgi:AtzE family amidohydrolase